MKYKTLSLVESVDVAEAFARDKIDEASGVIKGVVLMTANKVSRNNTRYSSKALAEAKERYEGAKMYLDHPRTDELEARRGNRSVRDLSGVYRNLMVQEGPEPKLLGDLHLMEHNKEIAISIAKNPPKGTGLSLRDRGRTREEKGVTLVEGFEGDEFSIDLVVSASLNKSLFESAQEGGGDEVMDLTKLTMEELKEGRKDLVESIQKEATQAISKQLEEAGVKSVEASKMVLLAESGMPSEFKDAIRPAVMKAEVTLEEAKKLISLQEGLAAKLKEEQKKGAGNGDPDVKGQGARKVEEGKQEAQLTDDEILAALKR
jgi:hypothetical protein